MAQLIKDTLPLMEVINNDMAKAARNHGLPVFKGKLFCHKGGLNENLDRYGRPIFNFVNENTVVIGGAVLALKKLFGGIDMASYTNVGYMPKSLNEIYNINASVEADDAASRIALFGCGIGGSNLEWGSVKDPDFKMYTLGNMAASESGMDISNTWLPFRISTSTTISPDETGQSPSNYFFRKSINLGTGSNSGYAWYLKEFTNSKIPIKCYWQNTIDPADDGAEITGDLIPEEDMDNTDLIECFGECMLTISEDDLREFFIAAGQLTYARFNQIGLFTGQKKQISNDYYDYVGVRLFSVVNFNNVSVQEPSTNVYLYRIYSAV